ncbi:hypothetical protein BKH46_06430 [Helicobacter sp. 12S02634-8]|uniref:hypothetical protein n=1 Tax=Helicobacter sp. 12S02634-8 TaxID=1476199 RepID=UPI000BA5669C|nr:hypothetical protein [Helicobacter sp. 12S02634-8]PAF46847.1 hypothetical protein BKH46_06430 [Helicobacter sp. 12S02634-8]
MKKLLLLLTLTFSIALSDTITSIQVFKQPKSLDILLFSDTPITSVPQSLVLEGQKILLLQNTTFKAPKQKWQQNFANAPIESLEIFSQNGNLYIIPKSKIAPNIQAAQSKDGATLRLHFAFAPPSRLTTLLHKTPSLQKAPIDPALTTPTPTISDTTPKLSDTTPTNTAPSPISDYRYGLILGIMVLLIGVLLFVRKKLRMPLGSTQSAHYPRILFSKPLDTHNKIILLQYQNNGYIILLGQKQNLLLDKFTLPENATNATSVSDDFWASLKPLYKAPHKPQKC